MTGLLDAILALVLLEGAVLSIMFWRTGRGVRPASLWSTLAAGGFIILAMRLALSGAPWWLAAASLGAAGLAHGADLWMRSR